MQITIPKSFLRTWADRCPKVKERFSYELERDRNPRKGDEFEFNIERTDDEDLAVLELMTKEGGAGSRMVKRQIENYRFILAGKIDKVRIFTGPEFEFALNTYLSQGNRLFYKKQSTWSGRDQEHLLVHEPFLAVRAHYKDSQYGRTGPHVDLHMVSVDGTDGTLKKDKTQSWACETSFGGKPLLQLLTQTGITKTTPEVEAEYAKTMENYNRLADQRGVQCLRIDPASPSKRERVVIDQTVKAEPAPYTTEDGDFMAPVVPHITVFRVEREAGDHMNVDASELETYVYRPELREEIILPETHREIIDVLSKDLNALGLDLVAGKGGGTIILAHGLPGVGKTLTAEIYAEVVKRPLYSVHSGQLGIDPDDIEKNLRKMFDDSERLNLIPLLDEADVFVMRRGTDLTQNAVVSAFLRILEYIQGIVFLTSNRPGDIDEAILSRCAAVVEYNLPQQAERAKLWRKFSDLFGSDLSTGDCATLAKVYNEASGRDIRDLLRLSTRMARGQATPVPVTVKLIDRYAPFRHMHNKDMGQKAPREKTYAIDVT